MERAGSKLEQVGSIEPSSIDEAAFVHKFLHLFKEIGEDMKSFFRQLQVEAIEPNRIMTAELRQICVELKQLGEDHTRLLEEMSANPELLEESHNEQVELSILTAKAASMDHSSNLTIHAIQPLITPPAAPRPADTDQCRFATFETSSTTMEDSTFCDDMGNIITPSNSMFMEPLITDNMEITVTENAALSLIRVEHTLNSEPESPKASELTQSSILSSRLPQSDMVSSGQLETAIVNLDLSDSDIAILEMPESDPHNGHIMESANILFDSIDTITVTSESDSPRACEPPKRLELCESELATDVELSKPPDFTNTEIAQAISIISTTEPLTDHEVNVNVSSMPGYEAKVFKDLQSELDKRRFQLAIGWADFKTSYAIFDPGGYISFCILFISKDITNSSVSIHCTCILYLYPTSFEALHEIFEGAMMYLAYQILLGYQAFILASSFGVSIPWSGIPYCITEEGMFGLSHILSILISIQI